MSLFYAGCVILEHYSPETYALWAIIFGLLIFLAYQDTKGRGGDK